MVKYMNIKIGIPRSFFYYYYGNLWINFFKELDIDIVISPKTNKIINELGNIYSQDEMCMSLKNYLGHIAYLKDKCDYILIPRIDNYGLSNQTCTNFISIYDVINNLFDIKILNYNVNIDNLETEKDGLVKIATNLGVSRKKACIAYRIARIKQDKLLDFKIINNTNKLKSDKIKVLFVSHAYNTFDEYIGIPIIKLLEKMNIEIIYSDYFDKKMTKEAAKMLSQNLYWKYSKESIGSIILSKEKIDGIIFLSTFPCGIDSLVNELVIRKISIPYLNIILDDLDSLAGIETRIESFVDILEQKINV